MIPNKEISKSNFLYAITYQKRIKGGEATICETNNPNTLYKYLHYQINQNLWEKIN